MDEDRRRNARPQAADILAHFERVKQLGPDRWSVKNPLRPEQRTNSTYIKRAEDRWLIHDFAGEDASEILAAVGLSLADLFDEPLSHRLGPVRDRRHIYAAQEGLKSLAHESLVALVGAENAARGIDIGPDGRARLALAAERIRGVREVAS